MFYNPSMDKSDIVGTATISKRNVGNCNKRRFYKYFYFYKQARRGQ